MKEHDSATAEGEYCRLLGDIAPEIYVVTHGLYVMEYLEPAHREPGLLQEMETALQSNVWERCLTHLTQHDAEWHEHLTFRTGLLVPHFARAGHLCMTHGDCTVSNAMRRGTRLVIGDPISPRPHVARFAETDMGRLLQSAAGWESVAYGESPVEWDMPQFWTNKRVRRRALWWCGATARRILVDWQDRGQLTPDVREWCEETERRCFSATIV